MTGAELTALISDVNAYLSITWNDPAENHKTAMLVQNGMAYLDSKLGSTADYMQPGLPRALLMDYVRYARSNALEVFETNYRSLLLAMQNEKAVSDYVQDSQALV